ncbi:DEAD/DEAH box helicase [Mycoplasmopsis ciconiae]|uniref:DEAD/DEAH box helicase n=1 Tax=Mycoplasmopsis ciconiae TaxID=561067 RepID=A0ABU7MM98_9BACT|nr:DEAD/DEAH box helicase [Mycoplasmopsis ciconiae]
MISSKERYKVILDNLLEVTPNDPSVFTNVNNKFFFDIYKLFGGKVFQYIYQNSKFEIPVVELNLLSLIEQIQKANSPELVLQLLKNNEQEITDFVANQLQVNFEQTKLKVIEKIRVDFQKSNLKWKLLADRSSEINDEINIWPMHLAFLYVSIAIDEKVVYAPLFFKEVYLEFKNGRTYLKSDGNIKINEKILFILENAGFDIRVDFDYSELTMQQLFMRLQQVWSKTFSFPQSIYGPFKKLRSDDIKNRTMEFHSGMVLGLFLPSGGYSRNRMKEIIENDEIDNIFDIEFNKNIYKYKIKNTIFDPKVGLFKITPTNYSQDKAIVSSLSQNTIIWGPPGTGKSQTIVNLLANILVYGKTALVASQKKAALEVIRNRMGDLRMFGLFILTSKDMKRNSFYKPLKNYINYLEYFEESYTIKPLKILSDAERIWVEKVKEISQKPKYLEIVQGYFYLRNNMDKLTQDDIDFVLSLPRNVVYPHKELSENESAEKYILKANKMSVLPFSSKYFELKKLGKLIDARLSGFKGSLSELVVKFRNLEKEDLNWLRDFIDLLPDMESEEFTDISMIKNIVAERVINKILNFSPEKRKRYNEFAASIRIGNLEPYKFVKVYSDLIKEIFPIIIATPDTDLSGWEKEEFDYAIIDESSQIFIEKGLPILYLAKIKVLAGDDKQMKPTNWFGVRTTDESIFGNVESLLDYAISLGVYNILLDKNYRSNHASLMTFSSKYFYDSSLDVIDSALNDNSEAIEVIEVKGSWSENKNIAEAKMALDVVEANLKKYKKIILLAFNAKQLDYLVSQIYEKYPDLENAIRERQLMIRNIENIQGDEADLIVVTIGYDKSAKIISTYVGRNGGMNALNVAISRAKEKMIVIKTIKANDINNYHNSPDTAIFREWLRFLELTNEQRRDLLFSSVNKRKNAKPHSVKTSLSEEVKKAISEKIKPIMNVTLQEDYSVGTIHLDLLISVDNHPYKAFIFDDFSYANDLESYVLFKDYYRFLKSKHYDAKILNDITWLRKKNEILADFSLNKINEFINKGYSNNINIHNEELENSIMDETSLDELYENKDSSTLTKEWNAFLEDESSQQEKDDEQEPNTKNKKGRLF